jgi:DNA-binding CsgD family transcriptional regulator
VRAGTRPDPIRIVEAAYVWEPDETRWLDGVVRAAAPYDIGGGVIACSVGIAERTAVGPVCKTERASDQTAEALARVAESFPPRVARDVLAPTEFVGNAAYRLSRIARAHEGSTAALVRQSSAQLPPLWALISGDSRRRSLLLCFPAPDRTSSTEDPFPHRDARSLGLVGAHLAAALRLRGLVQPATADDSDVEAVLGPTGKVLHATGAAAAADARASLAEAVRASQAARGRMRRSSPEEALALWTALVRGRWTILDATERDGKRILLARKNPLGGAGLLDLDGDERDVAWLAAQGHSYKYIAYELGIPLSTVAGRLRRAMRKLRVGSRTELLQKLGAVGDPLASTSAPGQGAR